ncbi:MAG: acylphosphatase [Thermoplasmata archaeon]
MNVTKKLRFYGRVQGINFRSNTLIKAIDIGVKGWIKNLPDGSVESEFSGDEDKVNDLIRYCVSEMPYANVIRYEQINEDYKEFSDFHIER